MSDVFFIGDTHFGHSKIIQFEATRAYRPFSSIEEHDEELVCRWNARVSKRDIVWHLGDFGFGRASLAIAGRLNGLKRLVMGNHDQYPATSYLEYFHSLHGVAEYKGFVLTHIPIHQSSLDRWRGNIHGHLHADKMGMASYIGVSAEQINLTPISFDELMCREHRQ
jgi:calcineurin-like phosphoesterase family protein